LKRSLLFNNVAYASENNPSISTDSNTPYSNNLQEIVNIDGIDYVYTYSLSTTGNRVITVENTSTNHIDIIEYDENTSQILLNGEISGMQVSNEEDITSINESISPMSNYKYIGSTSKKISWGQAVGTATLAAMIASGVGVITGATVIACMGASALSVIAAACANGVVKTKVYSMVAGKITTYKYVWSFTPSGSQKYGDYTSYVTV
jgi:hypothetical protein